MKQLRGYTVGSIAPSSPQTGDRWHELSPLGFSLNGWDWIWSGARWISPLQFWEISFSGTPPTFSYFYLKRRGILLTEMRLGTYSQGSQSSSFWRLELFAVTQFDSKTFISTLDTAGQTPFQNIDRSAAIAGVYSEGDNNTRLLQFILTPGGSTAPPGIFGSAILTYHFTR